MGTTRLLFEQAIKPIKLPKLAPGERREIEVPAGESLFFLSQTGESDARYVFNLRHAGTSVRVTGLVEATGESAPTLLTETVHHSPNTKAEMLIHTIAYDAAQPRYTGLIRIEKGAVGAESYLNHHSLLIGEKAASWTLPSLEIKNNEVRCSHAATVRTVNDLDLFYLRSRGMDKDAARDMIIEAFRAEVGK